jgi:hypothetical protein
MISADLLPHAGLSSRLPPLLQLSARLVVRAKVPLQLRLASSVWRLERERDRQQLQSEGAAVPTLT